jgi:hypothetical protein
MAAVPVVASSGPAAASSFSAVSGSAGASSAVATKKIGSDDLICFNCNASGYTVETNRRFSFIALLNSESQLLKLILEQL